MPDKNQLDAKAAELKAREDALSAREAAARKADAASFCEGLTKEGRLSPAHRDGAADFMVALEGATLAEFAEATKQTPLDWFKGFLKSLPPQISFAETKPEQTVSASTADFAVAPGYEVNADSLAIHGKARAFMAAHPGTDYPTALTAVWK